MVRSSGGRHAAPERKKRKFAVAVVFAWAMALVVSTAGVGYAVWTVSGTGQGSAKATTAVNLTVAPGSATGQLYPGGDGDVEFSVTNNNDYAVTVTGWSGATVQGTDKAGCNPGHFAFKAGTVTGGAVPAKATQVVKITGGITMTAAAPNECQSAAVTVSATLAAQ